jgi:hypothetical protein
MSVEKLMIPMDSWHEHSKNVGFRDKLWWARSLCSSLEPLTVETFTSNLT